MRHINKSISRVALALTTMAVGGLMVCQPSGASTTNINVVGYSVAGPAFKDLEAAFQLTPAGQNVTFTNTFGASDTETSNVAKGLPADIVNLSYGSNVTTLVNDNLVPSNWSSQELSVAGVNTALTGAKQQTTYSTPGILTDSTVVFIVRKGNPLGIKTWSDLIQHGVQVVTPNPATSGSAKWNLLAGYAAWEAEAHTGSAAQSYLESLLSHTVAQPTSGSSALAAFLAGTGNVLLDYEDDAIAAQQAGDAISIVVPAQTLLIENPVALTDTGVQNPAAEAFYKYIFSVHAQTELASLGYRSVLKSVWNSTKSSFPTFAAPSKILTLSSINSAGWSAIDPAFFGPSGTVTNLEQYAGSAL